MVNKKKTKKNSTLSIKINKNKFLSSSLFLQKNQTNKYLKLQHLKQIYKIKQTVQLQQQINQYNLKDYFLKLVLKPIFVNPLIKEQFKTKYYIKYNIIIKNKLVKPLSNKKKNTIAVFKQLIAQSNKKLNQKFIKKYIKSLIINTSHKGVTKIAKNDQYKITKAINKNMLDSSNNKVYNSLFKSKVLPLQENKRQYNILFESITLNTMVNFGFHYGCKKRNRNRSIEQFYGRYQIIQQNSYININIMILNLRKGLNFIRYALIKNSQLMLLSWSKELNRIPVKIFKQGFFFKGPWFPGFLSNFRNIRQHGSFWYKKKFFPKTRKSKQAPLTTLALSELGLKIFPNLLFTIDSLYVNQSAITEALFLRMPTLAFINPTQFFDISQCIYPVLGSCSTYKQGRFFIFLIAMLLLDISLYRKSRIYQLSLL